MRLKQRVIVIFLICSCLFVFSCAPSKESYLLRYERYVKNIQTNYAGYNTRDWVKADRQVDNLNKNIMRRFNNKLTSEEKTRIANASDTYNSYRYGNIPSVSNIIDSQRTIENQSIEELRRITKQQEQISMQLEQLRRKILEDQQLKNTSGHITQQQKTEQELLVDRLQNELLMEILASKKQGRREVSGKIKILVFPTNFKGNAFRMNYNTLTSTIQEAINVILVQAKKYSQDILIDWEYRINTDGSYISLNNYSEGLKQYSYYKDVFKNYNHLVLVYVVDMVERSYCVVGGSLGKSESNAIIWFKDDNKRHSTGVIAHEVFHAFGAEDLYYEQGVVPQEVELNFRTLLGNSIMITSHGSSDLDPINAWLIGWNKKPESWYAWFIDRRDSTVDIGLYTMKHQNSSIKE